MPEPISLLLAGAIVATMNTSAYWDGDGAPPWGITASGAPTAPGIAACGPGLPFGTLLIPLDPTPHAAYVCRDRGGAIRDGMVDIWMEDRAAALRWGRRDVRMVVSTNAERSESDELAKE